jgi:hypothetical protein
LSKVTLILPKNRRILEDKFAEALAEIVSGMLSESERKYLLEEIERRESEGTL